MRWEREGPPCKLAVCFAETCRSLLLWARSGEGHGERSCGALDVVLVEMGPRGTTHSTFGKTEVNISRFFFSSPLQNVEAAGVGDNIWDYGEHF